MKSPKSFYPYSIYLTKENKAKCRKEAKKLNLSESAYIRLLIEGGK